MQILQKIIVLILVVGVLGAGYYIYINKDFLFTKNTPVTINNIKNDANTQPQKSVVQELFALDLGASATVEQVQNFSTQVANVAIKSEILDVSQCNPNPPVLHLKMRQSFTLKNSDSVSHKLFHGQGVDVTIEAGSQKVFTPNFPNPGIYGYACDNKINGIFFVVP